METNLINEIYSDLIWRCLMTGQEITTRNSQVRRNPLESFEFSSTPLVCLRKTAWRNAIREWEWFMSGSSNINDLAESVRPWWSPWADEDGYVHNNYSAQFRTSFGKNRMCDQIEYLVEGVKTHPFSRRNVITTWNTADMVDKETPITNCHGTVIQAFVNPNNTLDLFTYQRSVDVICGLPHNWIQYWAFLQWLSHRTGRSVGKLTWMGGDIHIYSQHLPLARKIIGLPYEGLRGAPDLIYSPPPGEKKVPFRAGDFSLSGEYTPVLTDRAEMVV